MFGHLGVGMWVPSLANGILGSGLRAEPWTIVSIVLL